MDPAGKMPLLRELENMGAWFCQYTFGYTVAEISCPTKYFTEASSINLSRSIKYGFGCLHTALTFHLAKMKLITSHLFPDQK